MFFRGGDVALFRQARLFRGGFRLVQVLHEVSSVQNGKHITLLDLLSAARREVHEPSGNLERKIHTVVGADCSRIAQARNLYPGPYNFATERTHRLRFIGTVFPGDGEQPDCGYRPCQNQASGGLYEQ